MKTEDLAQEVVALEERLAEAEQAGNPAALYHLVALDFSGINALGHVVDREAFIEPFRASDLLIQSLKHEDLNVRMFDRVAIATGISIARGMRHEAVLLGRYHFTDVWVRRLMDWELVYSHVSPAADA